MKKIEAELKDILEMNHWRFEPVDREKTCVYIVRNLQKREVLYVGVSNNPYARMAGHFRNAVDRDSGKNTFGNGGSAWAINNCSVEIIWYSNREDAEISEKVLINMLMPKYNASGFWNNEVLYAEEA